MRQLCVARACADARYTNDTNVFPQTTLFVVSKSRPICVIGASFACHVTEKKRTPHLVKSVPLSLSLSDGLLFWSGTGCTK